MSLTRVGDVLGSCLSVYRLCALSIACVLCLLSAVGGEPFRAFCQLGAGVVKAALATVGWSERTQDSHTDKLLRATVVGLLPGKTTSLAVPLLLLSCCSFSALLLSCCSAPLLHYTAAPAD